MRWHKVQRDGALLVVLSLAVPLVVDAARLLGPPRVPSSARIVTGIGVAIITGVMVAAGCAPVEGRIRCLLATVGNYAISKLLRIAYFTKPAVEFTSSLRMAAARCVSVVLILRLRKALMPLLV